MASKTYDARRDQGLCGRCGAPSRRAPKTPPVCRRIARETGRTLERVSTLSTCQACLDKDEAARASAAERNKRQAQRNYRRNEASVEDGRCTSCGKPNDRPGKHECTACAGRTQQANRDRRARREAEGVCVRCGGYREDERYKTCMPCRKNEAARLSGKRERSKIRRQNAT